MSAVRPGPRERLISTAIAMVQERGVHATGLSDLLRRSSAARNSIYQHFPGGKQELMVAATETAGAVVAARVDRLAETGDPAAVLRAMIAGWVAELEDSDFRAGCPIAAAALAGPDEPAITAAAADAFAGLRTRLDTTLRAAGQRDSARTASVVISAIEGALLQARAAKSVQPLRDLEAILPRLLSPA
ncbi:TetR/AcrR family transcriptional regulator [Mycolicibacterium chitae]|uniref:TetR family transcriptional regulator n=1 Tax=Mycolicibacterium chitae TaxID=1792 RepID=A0A448I0B9_MYCCI|nr:TetR/AcrR family transcriptional regulator [Mycolicibacterium chitae]MCV7105637.1 TetR/AcrR family transcriptional regulator [Mycolicibacterium chitae]VEG45881.1 TetR family transcriptional regulator [Mycolicibacterium chitae]